MAALLMGFGFIALILVVGWYVLQVVAYWLIFSKAGQPGWKSLIPFYNTFIQYRITWDTHFFWIWLICTVGSSLIPANGTFAAITITIFSLGSITLSAIAMYKLSLAFGHGIGYALGLFFIQPIFMLILGFGSSRYIGPDNSSRYIQG